MNLEVRQMDLVPAQVLYDTTRKMYTSPSRVSKLCLLLFLQVKED